MLLWRIGVNQVGIILKMSERIIAHMKISLEHKGFGHMREDEANLHHQICFIFRRQTW